MNNTISTSGMATVGNVSGSERMNLADLVFAVMTERASLIETSVRSQVDDITKKNERISEINKFKEHLKELHDQYSDDIPLTDEEYAEIKALGINPEDVGLPAELPDETVDIAERPEAEHDLSLKQKNYEKLDGLLDDESSELTSMSQLDMANLQSTMGKYNNTYDAMSNFINKYGQSVGTIINNLR